MQQSNATSSTFFVLGTDGIIHFHHPVNMSFFGTLKNNGCIWIPINLDIHGKPLPVQNYLTEYNGTYNNYPIQELATIENGFFYASTTGPSFITYKIKSEIKHPPTEIKNNNNKKRKRECRGGGGSKVNRVKTKKPLRMLQS